MVRQAINLRRLTSAGVGRPQKPMARPTSDRKLGDSANAGDFAACQVPVEIAEILFQFRQRLALGQVVRKLFKIPEPHASVLPVNVTGGAHETILLLYGAC
jgi:hypothetical protein